MQQLQRRGPRRLGRPPGGGSVGLRVHRPVQADQTRVATRRLGSRCNRSSSKGAGNVGLRDGPSTLRRARQTTLRGGPRPLHSVVACIYTAARGRGCRRGSLAGRGKGTRRATCAAAMRQLEGCKAPAGRGGPGPHLPCPAAAVTVTLGTRRSAGSWSDTENPIGSRDPQLGLSLVARRMPASQSESPRASHFTDPISKRARRTDMLGWRGVPGIR